MKKTIIIFQFNLSNLNKLESLLYISEELILKKNPHIYISTRNNSKLLKTLPELLLILLKLQVVYLIKH